MDEVTNSYSNAVKIIKRAVLESQRDAAKAVNSRMLALYYGVGKYVSDNSRKCVWGSGAIEEISRQLQSEMPGLKGFSAESIKKMRIFYEQWSDLINRSPMAIDLEISENKDFIYSSTLLDINRSPMATDFNWYDFMSISFTHHMEILYKTKTLEERSFYIHQTATLRWDKYTLRNNLKKDLFHHQSQIPNNFVSTIPDYKQAFQAIQMFKDEYLLDFINTEELGVRDEDIDERIIEQSIIHNIKNFILSFGKGFSFVGNQVHFDKLGHDHWIDLLFYNRDLQRLVVFELKKGDFKVGYLAQLSTYLRILNDEEKRENEKDPIGIILCKSIDKSYVEYIMQDFRQPMGVATYKTANEMEYDILKVLPPKDALQKLLKNSSDK